MLVCFSLYNSNSLPTGELVKNVEQEPTKPYVVVSFGTGLAPEVFVKDYNVSKVEGPLGAGRFLLGVKEFAETLVEQVRDSLGTLPSYLLTSYLHTHINLLSRSILNYITCCNNT